MGEPEVEPDDVGGVCEDEPPGGVGLSEPVCGAGSACHVGPYRAAAASITSIASLIVLDPRTSLVRQLRNDLKGGGGVSRLTIAARRLELDFLCGANSRVLPTPALATTPRTPRCPPVPFPEPEPMAGSKDPVCATISWIPPSVSPGSPFGLL